MEKDRRGILCFGYGARLVHAFIHGICHTFTRGNIFYYSKKEVENDIKLKQEIDLIKQKLYN